MKIIFFSNNEDGNNYFVINDGKESERESLLDKRVFLENAKVFLKKNYSHYVEKITGSNIFYQDSSIGFAWVQVKLVSGIYPDDLTVEFQTPEEYSDY